jgi:hypothetical protein
MNRFRTIKRMKAAATLAGIVLGLAGGYYRFAAAKMEHDETARRITVKPAAEKSLALAEKPEKRPEKKTMLPWKERPIEVAQSSANPPGFIPDPSNPKMRLYDVPPKCSPSRHQVMTAKPAPDYSAHNVNDMDKWAVGMLPTGDPWCIADRRTLMRAGYGKTEPVTTRVPVTGSFLDGPATEPQVVAAKAAPPPIAKKAPDYSQNYSAKPYAPTMPAPTPWLLPNGQVFQPGR